MEIGAYGLSFGGVRCESIMLKFIEFELFFNSIEKTNFYRMLIFLMVDDYRSDKKKAKKLGLTKKEYEEQKKEFEGKYVSANTS